MVQITKRTDATEEMMIVRLTGDLDLGAVASARSVFHEILHDGWTTVLVDLEDVSFIDSAGLGILIGLHRRCLVGGGHCVLVNCQSEVTHLLEVTGLDAIVLNAESLEAGAALAMQQKAASAT